ncbi:MULTISPECIES: GNAT family N-acetyltransferase [unclassified Agarivorans]|uniref:GNAT family N-acetyltransferase n=1 Tax=unclassified Agarivorans TaxID=2636026 RepID=UPI0026E30938|nr:MULTISPECIES: GNAT family protein [unclassified Agarivorans]MDO6686522.1 GNAT family protein [Agarivorans sp. 3_MG-2023]MDO6715340.1 GNAT family protein [Agarivorans sp. 2_MG-2023]
MTRQPYLIESELSAGNVLLQPLQLSHRAALLAAEADGRLSQLWYTSVPNADSIDAYFDSALQDKQQGVALPFVVIDKPSGNVIGATRYCHADVVNRRLEIGYTWYAKSYQRSSVNTQCKLLLLSYAFEQLGSIAVEFRTHWHNHASRAAIARLGAKQDGVLRNHSLDAQGNYRDTVVFSITNQEWPTVKHALLHKLASYAGN